MDNVVLINQARNLYAVLQLAQSVLSIENKTQINRLDRIIRRAYCRYQRRLNRCVLCYHDRVSDCCQWTSKRNTELLPNGYQTFNWPKNLARKVRRHEALSG